MLFVVRILKSKSLRKAPHQIGMAGIKARIPKIHPPPAQIKRLRRCFLRPLTADLSRVALFYRPLVADLSREKGQRRRQGNLWAEH